VFLKLGDRVMYRLEDVERYEAERLQANTVGPIASGVTRHEG
jgi:hypothetical protein